MKKAIYKITNKVNGKIYIGQSTNPHRRFIAHCSRAMNDADNSPIHKAIKKYGKENFILEVLEWTEDYDNRERDLIRLYNSIAPYGYNILPGGEKPPVFRGEKHHKNKIKEWQVDKVIELLKEGLLTEPEIGRSFSPPLNQVMINSINFGITHRRDGEKYPIRTKHPYTLDEVEVSEIKWLLENCKHTCKQIAEHYDVNTSTIKHINSGRNYNDGREYPIRKFRGSQQSEPVETILAKRSTNAIDTHLEMGVCTDEVYKK